MTPTTACAAHGQAEMTSAFYCKLREGAITSTAFSWQAQPRQGSAPCIQYSDDTHLLAAAKYFAIEGGNVIGFKP